MIDYELKSKHDSLTSYCLIALCYGERERYCRHNALEIYKLTPIWFEGAFIEVNIGLDLL